MHRQRLLALLDSYIPQILPYDGFDVAAERLNLERLRDFVRREPHCFERSCPEGHITASALVTDPACEKVLLTLHAKLGKWLQLGGHTDGASDVPQEALREAQEESGRPEVELFPDAPLPFDIDIHEIPARKNEPAHLHYDVRFLCRLDPELPFVISAESKDLRWLNLSDAQGLTDETSMQRQFFKLLALRERIFPRSAP